MFRYLIRVTFLFITFMAMLNSAVIANHANAEKKEYCLSAMPSVVNSRQQRPITGYVYMSGGRSSDDKTLGIDEDQKVYFAE